jgi:hypothetical protein
VTLTIPTGDDAAALADWAELLVLTEHRDGISTTRLERLLRADGNDLAEEELTLDQEGVGDEGEEGDELELELLDVGRGERELRLEQLLEEVALRLRLGPKLYPFETEDERLVPREAAGSEIYLVLLILSSKDASFRKERRAHEVEASFDRISLSALRRYLGRSARGTRFAKNAHVDGDNETRPQRFRDAIRWLRGQLEVGPGLREPPDTEREAHWEDEGVEDELGRTPLNSYSDGGVDVVVWWRFADGRAGSPVLLGQCTVQLEWSDKVSDIDVELWGKWIDFDTVPPQTALVIPFAVNRASAQWNDRTVTAGVIIDRLRMLELLNELDEESLRAMVDEATSDWVQREFVGLS